MEEKNRKKLEARKKRAFEIIEHIANTVGAPFAGIPVTCDTTVPFWLFE